jgi:diguanylate cyclase (GGDEF)-like protein
MPILFIREVNFWAIEQTRGSEVMDYGTFFITNIATVTAFTVCMTLLALYNRRVKGMGWFAGGLAVGLVKLILQGLDGNVPTVLSSMVANELYLVSFMMQFMGLRWFVLRKPMRSRWPWMAIALVLTTYTILYLERIPYSGNVTNSTFIAICGASAWILFKYGQAPFVAVSRTSAVILCGEGIVATYRAVLTNLRYMRPWEIVHARTDPRWLYSLASMAFLAIFMVMCDLWFLVTELQSELAEQARTDYLTGAMNRRAMDETAEREVSRSLRYSHPLSMIVIDIDNFKRLNDTRGHAAGDRVLWVFACRVKKMLRATDLLARTGGDEFAILLPDTSAAVGRITAERLKQAVAALEVPFETGPIKFTVSAGVAELDPKRGNWEEMMRRADEAMYKIKQHGRNAVAARLAESESCVLAPKLW